MGRVAVLISGAALVATVWIAAWLTIIPALDVGDARRIASVRLHTETLPLTCLSPQQAADIINPYIRGHGSAYYIPSTGISAITVRATWEELSKARNLIHDFESDPKAACHVHEGSLLSPQASPSPFKGTAPVLAPGTVPTALKTR
jgi:hypothetical protein